MPSFFERYPGFNCFPVKAYVGFVALSVISQIIFFAVVSNSAANTVQMAGAGADVAGDVRGAAVRTGLVTVFGTLLISFVFGAVMYMLCMNKQNGLANGVMWVLFVLVALGAVMNTISMLVAANTIGTAGSLLKENVDKK